MIATAIILFREVLEMSIIIGVVLAATSGIAYRAHWVMGGVAAGIGGAGLLALGANAITEGLEGIGQEVMNGVILALAALMIGWTVIWMKHHARELTSRIRKVGEGINEGHLPLYSIAVIIALAVLREGAEIVLFLFSLTADKQVVFSEVVTGALAGFAAGAVVGTMLYFGLLTLSRKHLFTTTSVLLAFLAAGMASQAAGYFSAAGLLPELVSPVWDSSWLLQDSSVVGKITHALIGYTATPTGIQLVFYIVTLMSIGGLVVMTKDVRAKNKK